MVMTVDPGWEFIVVMLSYKGSGCVRGYDESGYGMG